MQNIISKFQFDIVSSFTTFEIFLRAILVPMFASFTAAFIVMMIGFMLSVRSSRTLIDQQLISQTEMTKIGTLYFFAVALLVFVLPHRLIALSGAVFLPLVIVACGVMLLVHSRARAFRDQFIATLSLIILKMKSGKSFRQALLETADESSPSTRAKLSEIVNVVSFSQQNTTRAQDQFVCEVIDELIKVDETPHSAIQRLSVFRDRLQIENDFRHKSGQAMAQARAQSLIMSFLYVALLFFVVSRFGFRGNERIILLSALLFAIGATWIWSGGRGFKWKV